MPSSPFSEAIIKIAQRMQRDGTSFFRNFYPLAKDEQVLNLDYLASRPTLRARHAQSVFGCSAANRISLNVQLNYVNMLQRTLGLRFCTLQDHYAQAIGRLASLSESGGLFNTLMEYTSILEMIPRRL
ncbi:MAG: hypothetical protein ABIK73_07740 [candidate division WOR-3 bacterium]